MYDFAQNFLTAASKYEEKENLVFSPLSLLSALAMLGLEIVSSITLSGYEIP